MLLQQYICPSVQAATASDSKLSGLEFPKSSLHQCSNLLTRFQHPSKNIVLWIIYLSNLVNKMHGRVLKTFVNSEWAFAKYQTTKKIPGPTWDRMVDLSTKWELYTQQETWSANSSRPGQSNQYLELAYSAIPWSAVYTLVLRLETSSTSHFACHRNLLHLLHYQCTKLSS